MPRTSVSTIPRFQKSSRYYRILEEVSAGDLFVGFLSSAGSTRLMSQLARDRARERYANKLALRRLEACGYVRRKSHDGKISFSVTAEGKRTLRGLYAQSSRVVMQPKEWDGMWRVVTYDFPEEQEQRSARNALRHVLSKSLFLQLQKSVWIFPYDSPLLADLFANNPIVRKHAVFMKVAHISSVESCKRHFHLS